jgi:hypothetical protein
MLSAQMADKLGLTKRGASQFVVVALQHANRQPGAWSRNVPWEDVFRPASAITRQPGTATVEAVRVPSPPTAIAARAVTR